MEAVVLRATLRVYGARSLKDKRSRIRPVVDRIRHRHHLSVSEVGYQDSWNRAQLGVAVVAPTYSRAVELMDAAEAVMYAAEDLEVIEVERTWVELEEM